MYEAHVTVINSTLYIGGGWCPNDPNKIYTVYQYDLDENQWSALPCLQQYWGIPVNINDQITIIGGRHSSTHKATKSVVTYSDNSWNNIYPNLSLARVYPAVVSYYQYIIVAGGKGDDNRVLDCIEIFDTMKSQWMIVNTHLPEPMYNMSSSKCDDYFIIVGYNNANNKRRRDTYMISVDEILSQQQPLTDSIAENNTNWHKLPDAPYWKTAIAPDISPPIIMGGSKHGDTFDDILMYDNISNSWKKVSSLPISCGYTTLAVINQSIISLGGCSNTANTETANASALNDVNIGQLVLRD